MKHVFLISILLTVCYSCQKEDQATIDENRILSYIEANSLDATATGTGLHYVISEQGTGQQPLASSTVKVAYKGYYTDGSVFDQSDNTGISFSLAQVIAGWTEGIPFFKEGGKGVLLIPSALGYGSQGSGGIPGNAVLIFDVHLIEVL